MYDFRKIVLKRSLLYLILFSFAILSCTADPVLQPATIAEFTAPFPEITESNAKQLSDVGVLEVDSISGPVADLVFRPAGETLLVAYAGEGIVREWDLESTAIIRESSIVIASVTGTGFDRSGDLLIAPGLHERRLDGHGVMNDFVGGIAVWDVGESVLRECIVYPCLSVKQEDGLRDTYPGWGGGLIDPNGRWVITYTGRGITLVDLSGRVVSRSLSSTSSETASGVYHISQVAFNSSGDRYAFVYENGDIVVRKVMSGLLDFLIFDPVIRSNYDGIAQSGSELGFSPAGDELAVAHNRELFLWRLKKGGADLLWKIDIQERELVQIDVTETLIFLVTSEAIQIYDRKDGSLIHAYPAPQISALHISPGSRMLFWGDTVGTVHLVAIK